MYKRVLIKLSGEALGEIIDALIAEDQADRLAEMD